MPINKTNKIAASVDAPLPSQIGSDGVPINISQKQLDQIILGMAKTEFYPMDQPVPGYHQVTKDVADALVNSEMGEAVIKAIGTNKLIVSTLLEAASMTTVMIMLTWLTKVLESTEQRPQPESPERIIASLPAFTPRKLYEILDSHKSPVALVKEWDRVAGTHKEGLIDSVTEAVLERELPQDIEFSPLLQKLFASLCASSAAVTALTLNASVREANLNYVYARTE